MGRSGTKIPHQGADTSASSLSVPPPVRGASKTKPVTQAVQSSSSTSIVEKEPAKAAMAPSHRKEAIAPVKANTPSDGLDREPVGKKSDKYDTSSPHFSAGMRLQYQGRFKEALAAFEAWLLKEPKNTVAWNCKGIALHGLGDYDGAIKCFEESLKIIPDDPPTTGNMGRTLHARGHFQEAVHWLEKSLAGSSVAGYWGLKGECLLHLGRLEEALDCYRRARDLEPKKAAHWSDEGAVHARLGSFKDALRCYQKAVEVEPDHAAAWFNKADAEERLGNLHAAINSLEKFLSLAPASMQSQAADARKRAQDLKRLVEAKAGNATSTTNEESIKNLPEPTKLIFRSCGSPVTGNEDIRNTFKYACKRYPVLATAISGNVDITIVREMDGATGHFKKHLSPTYEYDFGYSRGGVFVRCSISDASGNGLHELVIFWSKKNAQIVRKAIPDCEQQGDADSACSSTIFEAAQEGDLERVKDLLKANPDLVFSKDNHETTPLHIAVSTGHKALVELLLTSKADVNARDSGGDTPLHKATEKDVAELMLKHGANVNAENINIRTPLHEAAERGNEEVVELLLASGANVNAKENNGQTALHFSVAPGCRHLAELLVSNGANVNDGDSNDWTPFHAAVWQGAEDIVEFLLNNGAYVNAEDINGSKPLGLAVRKGHAKVAQLLRRHGGHE